MLVDVRTALVCPLCREELEVIDESLQCQNVSCKKVYPTIGGIPILLNETNSLFKIKDYNQPREPTTPFLNRLKSFLLRFLPSLSKNFVAGTNYNLLKSLLHKATENPLVLVVGGEVEGAGMDSLLKDPKAQLVETDVVIGPRTQYVCDGHDLPFPDNFFDAVVVQAVLEHVIDPYRVVSETYRVLKPKGLVYSEIPFLQPGHLGAYDFSRFTHLGHRRLFRYFEEIDSGAACGPGMALAQAYEAFLLSFSFGRSSQRFFRILARLSAFWLKYFDTFLLNRPQAVDAASATFFLGRKASSAVPDQEIVKLYRGI